jgi:creatinine amidohydrolase
VLADLITTATTAEEQTKDASVAVLPVGSFEQHGRYLPLITDTVVACAITSELARTYPVRVLPPITISCSHEHAAWPDTISIRASTLYTLISDITASLHRSGIDKLVMVNGHGGNYVLANITQEANVGQACVGLFPGPQDWDKARVDAGLSTTAHEDMHAGEIETSILLHVWPQLVRAGNETADHLANDRPQLLTLGMGAYTTTGVIGRPSAGTAEKGKAVLHSLTGSFADHFRALGIGLATPPPARP